MIALAYIVAREKAELQVSATKSESAENHERPLMSSAEALVASVQATGNRKERMRTHPKCRYCSENHWSDECEKYSTIEERKQKIKGSCYICLNPTYQSSGCRQRVHCYYCKQWNRHHRSLCPQQFGTVQGENSSLAEELPEENEVLNTENSLILSGEMVLMQTAKADVQNPVKGLRQESSLTRAVSEPILRNP